MARKFFSIILVIELQRILIVCISSPINSLKFIGIYFISIHSLFFFLKVLQRSTLRFLSTFDINVLGSITFFRFNDFCLFLINLRLLFDLLAPNLPECLFQHFSSNLKNRFKLKARIFLQVFVLNTFITHRIKRVEFNPLCDLFKSQRKIF